ncbi:MAG TPA: TlpA disulfide reductase family protein [Kofleriaceae bacterium]|nr:TlpA disulfide reductase family protein [Kofleriaceae bacterium]
MSTEPVESDGRDRQRPAYAAAAPGSSSSTKALLGVLLAGTAGMVIFLFVHLSKDGRIHPGPKQAQAECIKGGRDCLPDVSYVDTTGVKYSHESLAGKVVLVNFWATWCHPCQKEIPDLSKTYDKYKSKGVVFLGVLTDTPDSQQLLNFQSDYEMTYPIVRANSDLMVSFNYPDALPTTFVYDRSGKQVFSHVGPLRESDLDSLLGQLIAQN